MASGKVDMKKENANFKGLFLTLSLRGSEDGGNGTSAIKSPEVFD